MFVTKLTVYAPTPSSLNFPVWIDLGVCSSGFVDQMLGILGQIELVIAHLLPVMPIDTDVVLVAPQVVRSTQRPFAIGEDPKRSPTSYDALFNLDALAAYTSQANPRDIVARDCDAWEEDPVLRHLSRVHVVAATPDWVTGGKTGRVSTWDKECNIVAGAKGTALSRFVMARDLARKVRQTAPFCFVECCVCLALVRR